MDLYSQFIASGMLVTIAEYVYVFIVLFAPIALALEFWKVWKKYVRVKFLTTQPTVLLELQIPKGESKTPLSMELFITALHQTGGESTWYDRYILGKNRSWFSLEVTSFEGSIHFYIWTRERWKTWIESQLYAQFPDIEIRQVEDYTHSINFNLDEYDLWGADYLKKEPSHVPIRTYVNYGLDKESTEEEFKIDPLTPLLELLGSFGKGEQYWLQIGIRAHKKEMIKPGTWFEKVDWTHAAKEDIKKLMQRDKKAKEGEIVIKDLSMTKGEKQRIEAIENSLSKLAFDCVIRGLYIAKKENFNGPMGGVLPGILRPFNAPNLNTMGPIACDYDYPWQDFWGVRESRNKVNLFKVYRQRSFFFKDVFPYKNSIYTDPRATTIWTHKYNIKPFVMTTEELATIYHFPGDVARTPSLSRVTAKKAEPPANLPI